MQNTILNGDEKAVFALRSLYESLGYTQYKMSKFEEYDLYANNKDFLVSDNVITFTDTDGKLMALKPDVTLSIIKNGKASGRLQKVYYNENVYRVSKGTKSFKEIMQTGLECWGDVDCYAVTEVLYLAVKSLESISEDYILDISSLGLVSAVLNAFEIKESAKKQIINNLAEKNVYGVENVCCEIGLKKQQVEIIKTFVTLYGTPKTVLNKIDCFNVSDGAKEEIDSLKQVITALESLTELNKVRIDFSVINDVNYYNGIVFKGYVSGIPTGILAGGQYDNLMAKMNKKSKAIGFAVYLDELSRLSAKVKKLDAEVVVLYDKETSLKDVVNAVKCAKESGKTVLAVKGDIADLKYNSLINLKGDK